jgi:hypothetical protein
MGQAIQASKNMDGKPARKRPIGTSTCRREDNTKMDVRVFYFHKMRGIS